MSSTSIADGQGDGNCILAPSGGAALQCNPGKEGGEGEAQTQLTFNLEIMLASASSLALFWCTSRFANILA